MGGPSGKTNLMVDMVSREAKVPKIFRKMSKGVDKIKSTLGKKHAFFLLKKHLISSMRSCCNIGIEMNGMFQCSMTKFAFLIIPDIHGAMI